MKKNQPTAKRLLSLFLALVMLCTISGITVFAETGETADTSKEEEIKEDAEQPDSNPDIERSLTNDLDSQESGQDQSADSNTESGEETPNILKDASRDEEPEQTEDASKIQRQTEDAESDEVSNGEQNQFHQQVRAQSASPSNPVHHCTKQNDGSDYTDWSYVYFGSYPQTEVTEDALTSAVTGAAYDSNGDAWVNGVKYRRLSKSDTNNTDYFGDNTYRYFKWERIKWKVLSNDGSTLFLAADKGLDCKDYHDDGGSITWENCPLRNWLNNDFYGTAFSGGEQGAIVEQNVVNEDNPFNTEGGNDTRDKVYLLSIGEVVDPSYGFCENYSTYSVSRRVQASDYAHARGAYVNTFDTYQGNCCWWLRSSGHSTDFATFVDDTGIANMGGYYVQDSIDACVPALHINLSSDLWSVADDGSSGEGGNGTTGTGGDTSGNSIKINVSDIGDGKQWPDPLEHASVEVEHFGQAVTDAKGEAVIANTLTDQPLVNSRVSITKEGYREYYFYRDIYGRDVQLLLNSNAVNAMMRKLQAGDERNPYVSTLICQTSYGSYFDAMTSQRRYRVMGSGLDLKIQMNAVWNGKTPAAYELYQENGISYTSTDGKFQLDMGDAFKSKYPIYAKLTAADGTTVVEKTQFVIEGNSGGASSDGLNLIDTDSTGTLGEDVSFLSGQNVGIKLKNVKLDVSISEGKVKATIGSNKKILSEGGISTNEDWEDWKKLCEHQPKDLNLSQWKNVIDSVDTDWTGSVNGKTEVYGYLEGTVKNGSDTILSGKLKLKTSLSAGIQSQYTIGVVPVYAKISIGVDGGAEGAIAYNWTQKSFDFSESSGITLSLEPSLSAEGGVGVMAVATVGAEGKGSLPFSTKLGNSDGTSLSVKGGLSLKASLLKFEYSLKLAEKEWKLLPKEEKKSAVRGADISSLSMDDFTLSKGSNQKEDSLWLGENGIRTFSLETTETGSVERTLKTNINADAQVQLIDTGSTKMILWTEEDQDRETINSSKLVYSIYDEANDSWSAPAAVADDGTADYAPAVVTDGERIYAAWQNLDKTFDNTAELSEAAAASTIAMSVWTKEDGFSDAVIVSKKGLMAAAPKIALDAQGNPYAAYLQNTDNNLLLTTGQNHICYAVMNNGSVEQNTLVEDAGLVTAIDTAFADGYEVSYTLDTDGDLSTIEDREIVKRGAGKSATQNENMDSNVQYVKNGGSLLRFWYRDGSIVMADEAGTEKVVCQDETGALTDDFHVVSGQSNQLAIVWTAVDEEGNKQIEGSLYDASADTWSRSIRISDTDANVYSPQGIFTEDGKLQFLYKKTNEAQTDLCVLMAEPSVDLAIENAYADETAFVPGETAKISVQVKNNGAKKADGYTIDIAGTKTAVSGSLAPGESAVVEADYPVPSDFSHRTLAISVEAENDTNAEDNRYYLEVGYTDLVVNLEKNTYEFGDMIEIYAVNESCVDAEATLEIRKNSRDGELLESIDLGTISRGELAEASYIWDAGAKNNSSDVDALYFDVVSKEPEQYTDNNYDFTAVEKYVEPGTEPFPEPDEEAALVQAKTTAKTELESYKDAKDYREAQQKELTQAIEDGKKAIDAAADEAGVEQALSNAKSKIDKIKTDAQLKKEEKKEISSAAKAALSKTSYTYDGKAKKPGVTVKAGKTKLQKNKDYSVSYKNNKNVGNASVIITGKGSYTGKITKTFKIVPKGTSIAGKIKAQKKGFTVNWKKQKTSTSGYQLQYSTNSKFTKKTTVTKTVKKNSIMKLAVKKLKANKKYYVRVRTYKTVKGKKYVSSWSKVKNVKTKK